jgi:zinc protease
MKRHSKTGLIRLTVFLISWFLLMPASSFAQGKLNQLIPVDKNIRIGKLPNGLTYYIRKNSKPEDRVELRLAVNAGSVLEDDDQQGLAHFVEHMAFNGTKNFAKNDLVKYLQSVGVKFGPEINAYTSFDETVYMLTLPTDSMHILEKGFQIMEDWAHNLSFDDAEIDKERGVIVEEWRLGRGPFQRMQEKYLPLLFKGSRYAERIPIGKKEIIEGAPHDKIRKFYTDWYRPDLMAFIIVGDIDPDVMEKMIHDHFDKLVGPANPRVRERFAVPDQPGTAALVTSDKEAPYTLVQVICKTDPKVEVYQKDYRNSLIMQLVTGMLNQRLEELKEQANPPLLYSAVQFGSIGTREKSALQLAGLVPETGLETGIKTLITENERAALYGFTPGELERQKKQFYASYETAYKERDKTESEQLASEYIRNFLTDEPIPGIEFEYNFVKANLDSISLEEVNQIAGKIIKHDNRVVIVMAPQKEGVSLPDDQGVLATIETTSGGKIEPYKDKITGNQLMGEKPKKGRIILTKKNEVLGVTEMSLSNGAKVVLKNTDFKNDEILFRATSAGGYSLYDLPDYQSALYASDIVDASGLALYSPNDLSKLLAGKNVSLAPYIGPYFEGLNGSVAPRDLETMMQLAYLSFTQPRKDSALFESFIAKQKGVIKNLLSDPENYFSDQYNRIKTQNNPRADVIPTEKDIDNINFNRVFEIYHDRFADASDFTFFFVGSFKIDSLKPLIETYLASLPSIRRTETWKDMGIRPPSKKTDKSVYMGSDPKSIVAMYFESPEPFDPLQDHLFESLAQLLNIRYIEKLREEMSGVYGMGIRINLNKIPYSHLEISLNIPCAPENTDKLTKAALDEIRNIQKNGVTDDYVNKVKEAQRRDLEKNLKENGYWIARLIDVYRYNDPGLISQYTERINAVNSASMQAAAKKIDLDKYVRVVLYPEASKKK